MLDGSGMFRHGQQETYQARFRPSLPAPGLAAARTSARSPRMSNKVPRKWTPAIFAGLCKCIEVKIPSAAKVTKCTRSRNLLNTTPGSPLLCDSQACFTFLRPTSQNPDKMSLDKNACGLAACQNEMDPYAKPSSAQLQF